MAKVLTVFFVFLLAGFSGAAVVIVNEPSGLKSTINLLGEELQEQAGNYSFGEFNANPDRFVFSFDDYHGYGVAGSGQVGGISLTREVSGVALSVVLEPGLPWGRVRTSFRPTSSSEADKYDLAYAAGSIADIKFSADLKGVGFTINRVNGTVEVLVYDGQDNLIYEGSVCSNLGLGSERSFFGYYEESAEIRRIVVRGSSQQWSIDDLAVIVSSEKKEVALPDVSGVTGSQIDESGIDRVIYVNVDGNDLGSGSQFEPLKTVNEATRRASLYQQIDESTKVIIGSGVYRECVDALWDAYGTPIGNAATIVFEAAEYGKAIISASDIYSGWIRQGASNIYTHYWPYDWGLWLEPPDSLPVYRQKVFEYNPILRRREMFFVDGEPLTQVLSYDHYIPHDEMGVVELENSFYVDEDGNKVYIHLAEGADINEVQVEAAVRMYVFQASSVRNIVIRGLVFEHATNTINIGDREGGNGALHFEMSENVLLEDNVFQYNNGIGYSFHGPLDDSGQYYVYHPCKNLTLRRNISKYNGTGGIETNTTYNTLLEDNQELYNNWRGAMGTWRYDNSGRGLGLYSGWTGTRFYRMHRSIIRRHRAVGNYARGVWFDYDNEHVLFEDAYLHDNMEGLKFEVDQGPIWIKNCEISNNAVTGIHVAVANDVVLEGCQVVNNAHLDHNTDGEVLAQIRIPSGYTEHYIGPWEGDWPKGMLYMGNWKMIDNVIGGSADQPLIDCPDIDSFFSTLDSSHNYWYHEVSNEVFKIDDIGYDFAYWQEFTCQDSNSIFASSEPVPAFCGDFGTVYPEADINFDCKVDFEDYAMFAGVLGQDACDDPLVAMYEDLNHDCIFDIADVLALANNWLESSD